MNDFDVALDIATDENGEIIVKHEVSENYLSEYIDKWKQEAERRELEVDTGALRQEVLNDFVSLGAS